MVPVFILYLNLSKQNIAPDETENCSSQTKYATEPFVNELLNEIIDNVVTSVNCDNLDDDVSQSAHDRHWQHISAGE